MTFLLSQDFPRRQESATLQPGERRGAPLFDWRRPLTLKLATPDGRFFSAAAEVALPFSVPNRPAAPGDTRSNSRSREASLWSAAPSPSSSSSKNDKRSRSAAAAAALLSPEDSPARTRLCKRGFSSFPKKKRVASAQDNPPPASASSSREVSLNGGVGDVATVVRNRSSGNSARAAEERGRGEEAGDWNDFSDEEAGSAWQCTFAVELEEQGGSRPPLSVLLGCRLDCYVLTVVVSAPLWLLNLTPWPLTFEALLRASEDEGAAAERGGEGRSVFLPPSEKSRSLDFLGRGASADSEYNPLLCFGEPQFCLRAETLAFRLVRESDGSCSPELSLEGLAEDACLEAVGNLCFVVKTLDASFENAKLVVFKPAMVSGARTLQVVYSLCLCLDSGGAFFLRVRVGGSERLALQSAAAQRG